MRWRAWSRDGTGYSDDWLPEDTDGVLTRVARRGDEFIEDVVFLYPGRLTIARGDLA